MVNANPPDPDYGSNHTCGCRSALRFEESPGPAKLKRDGNRAVGLSALLNA